MYVTAVFTVSSCYAHTFSFVPNHLLIVTTQTSSLRERSTVKRGLVELRHRLWEKRSFSAARLYHTDHVFYMPHNLPLSFVQKYE